MYYNKETGERIFLTKPEDCHSTHSVVGYVVGSYMKPSGDIICSQCGIVCGNANDGAYVPSWMFDPRIKPAKKVKVSKMRKLIQWLKGYWKKIEPGEEYWEK